MVKMLGGDMGIIHVSKSVKKVLEMCGILKVIPIYDSIEIPKQVG